MILIIKKRYRCNRCKFTSTIWFFGELIKKIDQDKTTFSEKAAKTMSEKRKVDKSYGRPKKERK